jgi:lysozyme
VPSPRKPWWQQATALVSLGTGGAITGFAFAHGTADHLASPGSVPVTLTALDQAAQPPAARAASEVTVVRSAIVKVASYYARLAQTKTPAEMEALIWQQDSTNGADHGQSCAAFASMTLHLGAQLAGKQSWVTGGSTYPWPLHDWVDARVGPNSDSLNITSVLQDAESHQRWHALGDGYEPLPGDWVVFDNHVEVVTGFSGGVLATIGGDSLPNFSVNRHEYSGSLSSHGVQGFVNNGDLPTASTESAATSTAAAAQPKAAAASPARATAHAAKPAPARQQADRQSEDALAAIPGTSAQTASATTASEPAGRRTATSSSAAAAIPGMPSSSASPPASGRQEHPAQANTTRPPQAQPSASIPGVPTATPSAAATAPAATAPAAKAKATARPRATTTPAAKPSPAYQRHQASPAAAPASAATPGTAAQRAFIDAIAPGALAAQRTYGVPAAVTIAQAIDESNWGQSSLASEDHNLFGIKGTGPAGTVALPTHEVYDGETVSITAQFRVYDDAAQSIDDHGKLLADSGAYTTAMASRNSPNAFAHALTGVYATDPSYGTSLITLMRQYNLYRFDASAAAASTPAASTPATGTPAPASPKSQPHGANQSHPASQPRASARPRASASQRQASPTPAAKATSPTLSTPTASPSPRASTPAPSTSSSAPSSPAPSTSVSQTPASAPSPSATRHGSVPHPFATPSRPGTAAPSSGASGSSAGTGGSSAGSSNRSAGSGHGPTADTGSLGGADIPGIPATPATPNASSSYSATDTTPSTAPSNHTSTSADSTTSSKDSDADQASTSAAVQSHDGVAQAELTAVFHSTADTGPAHDAAAHQTPAHHTAAQPGHHPETAKATTAKKAAKRKGPGVKARRAAPRYQPELPPAVKNAMLATARKPLAKAEFLYRDVAAREGVSWKILAACDWMQCDAHPRYSPVRGEKLGTPNPDGTVFYTKSEALTQSARDLVALAGAVYDIDLTQPVPLSVPELANVFAAYRWGGLLRQHNTSALEFPYSVQGLTEQFQHMRWPKIANPQAPDKPGSRFRRPFGAVPVVLSLDYPAIVL